MANHRPSVTGCLSAPASTAFSVLGHSLVRTRPLAGLGNAGLEPLKAANGAHRHCWQLHR
jgi:hypothetical protein